MILCSLRVYLNVLTQIWTRDQLLNANYYILDDTKPGANLSYDEYNRPSTAPPQQAYTRFNITRLKGDLLNPLPVLCSVMQDITNSNSNKEIIIKELNKNETKSEIYHKMFEKELKGNKMQIAIYRHDETIYTFGDLYCEYLSQTFGCDIIFLDALCRRNINAKPYYQGNKANGAALVNMIQDFDLIEGFKTNYTMSGFRVGLTSNLSTWLRHKPGDVLIHLYDLLCPNDPLPPGDYTEDMLRDIIIGKSTEGVPDFGDYDSCKDAMELAKCTQNLWYNEIDRFDNSIDESFELDQFDNIEKFLNN